MVTPYLAFCNELGYSRLANFHRTLALQVPRAARQSIEGNDTFVPADWPSKPLPMR
jgi:hypothetical protein